MSDQLPQHDDRSRRQGAEGSTGGASAYGTSAPAEQASGQPGYSAPAGSAYAQPGYSAPAGSAYGQPPAYGSPTQPLYGATPASDASYGGEPYRAAPYGAAPYGEVPYGTDPAAAAQPGTRFRPLTIWALVLSGLGLLLSFAFGLGFLPAVVGSILGFVAIGKNPEAKPWPLIAGIVGAAAALLSLILSAVNLFRALQWLEYWALTG